MTEKRRRITFCTKSKIKATLMAEQENTETSIEHRIKKLFSDEVLRAILVLCQAAILNFSGNLKLFGVCLRLDLIG
jgi:hypothetical protein